MATDKNLNTDSSGEKEIDLIALWNVIWSRRKFIAIVCLIMAIIGAIFALSTPKEYTTAITYTANTSSPSTSSNIGLLASFTGINLNSGGASNGVDPALFAEVLKSSTFIQECFTLPAIDKEQGIQTNLYDYYLNHQKTSWISIVIKSPMLLLKLFKSKDVSSLEAEANSRFLSKDETDVMKAIEESYSISIDKKTDLITFNVTTQSPKISAFLADTITSLLQGYVIDFKIKKAQDDLASAEMLFKQAEEKYNVSLQKLAEFTDRNKNVVSAQYLIKQKELQNEQDLAYQVYTQMAQQVQVSKMAVQDQKPVFSIIQPAIEPLNPSAPNKKLILIGFVFIGLLGSCFWVLRKDLLEIIKG